MQTMTVNEDNFCTVLDAYMKLVKSYMELEQKYFDLQKENDELRCKVGEYKQSMIGGMFI